MMAETSEAAEASAVIGDIDVSLRVTVKESDVRCALNCDGRRAVVTFGPNGIDFDVE
jgi:hypothetical protein